MFEEGAILFLEGHLRSYTTVVCDLHAMHPDNPGSKPPPPMSNCKLPSRVFP